MLEEQAALRRVATLVAGDGESAQVFEHVCAEVGPLLGVESANLVRFEGSDRAIVLGGWGARGAAVGRPGEELTLVGDTAVVKLRASGVPERGDDYTHAAGPMGRRLREAGIRSGVAAPITVAGNLWGAIVASSGRANAFPPRAEQQLAGFAELVASALADADARERLRKLLDEQAALRRVATFVAGGPEPSAVLERVCAEVGSLLEVERTILLRFDGGGKAKIVGQWPQLDSPEFKTGEVIELKGESSSVKLYRSGRPERVDDYDSIASGHLVERIRAVGIASSISAPVYVEGKLWGALGASHGRTRGFPARAEHRIAAFTELVGDALANADARERLHSLLDEQAALRRVATLVAREPEPQEVFECVCEELGSVLGGEATNLLRIEADGTQRILAGWNRPGVQISLPVGMALPPGGDTAIPRMMRSGRPERIDDYSRFNGPRAELVRAAGIASAVSTPIRVAGRLWGALATTSGSPYGFPPDTEERIASFAELVADALANVDAREQLAASRARIVEAADAERRRLERNLHDGAQQRLVALALALRQARSELDCDRDAAGRRLEAADAQLATALEELRELARGIHPAILTDRGLRAALESLAETAPFPVLLEGVPEQRLPAPVEAAAYYIVAEGIANAAKHARPSEVTVRVRQAGCRAAVEIFDDGVGGADPRPGGGLRGLVDRVEALGGRLVVQSSPDQGTTLRAEIPLGAQASSRAANKWG